MSDGDGKIRAEASRDRAWAGLRGTGEELARIATLGPSDEADMLLIKSALWTVVGELEMRRLEMLDLEQS